MSSIEDVTANHRKAFADAPIKQQIEINRRTTRRARAFLITALLALIAGSGCWAAGLIGWKWIFPTLFVSATFAFLSAFPLREAIFQQQVLSKSLLEDGNILGLDGRQWKAVMRACDVSVTVEGAPAAADALREWFRKNGKTEEA